MRRVCSVCDSATDQGVLQCDHVFCPSCFQRYIDGSLQELLHFLRCSICGRITVLTTEGKSEHVEGRFGRDLLPRLQRPVGLCHRIDGGYVTADPEKKRVYVFTRLGKLKKDFAYVHQFQPQHGIVVNLCDEIVLACSHGERSVLAYFTIEGAFLGSAYLPDGTQVQGMVINNKNELLVTDSVNRCIYVVDELRRVVQRVAVPKQAAEKQLPEPHGIAWSRDGSNNIIVSDTANHNIKELAPDGTLKRVIGEWGARPGQFIKPMGICIDSRGRLLVADNGNNRIQLFDKEGNFMHFIVRYEKSDAVYMSPVTVLPLPNNMAAVLLRGDGQAKAAEIRMYSCKQVK